MRMSAKPNIIDHIVGREYGKTPISREITVPFEEEAVNRPMVPTIVEVGSGEDVLTTFNIAYDKRSQLVATSHGDHSIRIWTTSPPRQLWCLRGNTRSVWTMSFSPWDSHTLVSGSLAGEVIVWDLKSETHQRYQLSEEIVTCAAFHPKSSFVLFTGGNSIVLWAYKDGHRAKFASTDYAWERIRWLQFDPEGSYLFTGILNCDADADRERSHRFPSQSSQGSSRGGAGSSSGPQPGPHSSTQGTHSSTQGTHSFTPGSRPQAREALPSPSQSLQDRRHWNIPNLFRLRSQGLSWWRPTGLYARVAENMVNISSREYCIQRWPFSWDLQISDRTSHVVVSKCKLHNGGSINMSEDGTRLAVLQLCGVEVQVSVVSLQDQTLGQILWTTAHRPNVVSLSISPGNTFLLLGLHSPGPRASEEERKVACKLYRMEENDEGKSLRLERTIQHPSEFSNNNANVNVASFLPNTCEGILVGYSRSQLVLQTPSYHTERNNQETQK